MIYFSASPVGFYREDIHGADIPANAVGISEERYIELLSGQESGKLITADENGQPVLVDPPSASTAPRIISRFQALAALMQAGLLHDVESWAADPNTHPLHRLAFETAAEFSRTSPALNAGAEALGWTSEQLDDVFRAGAEILA
ncbi:hypothetical protein ACOTI9_14710 [Achromobacter mucicolens]|uniref:hypothetical protein n=1 Tax=Achromobacter mucicolens TaxID=1389922 RepID=UPI003B9C7BAE